MKIYLFFSSCPASRFHPRFAYFRPKPGTAEPELFSRAGRKTHCIPFASAPAICTVGQISSARRVAMCQPAARSADKMTHYFCHLKPIN